MPNAAQQGIHIQSHFAYQKCLPRCMYDKIMVFLCHQSNVIVRRMSESNKVFPQEQQSCWWGKLYFSKFTSVVFLADQAATSQHFSITFQNTNKVDSPKILMVICSFSSKIIQIIHLVCVLKSSWKMLGSDLQGSNTTEANLEKWSLLLSKSELCCCSFLLLHVAAV